MIKVLKDGNDSIAKTYKRTTDNKLIPLFTKKKKKQTNSIDTKKNQTYPLM